MMLRRKATGRPDQETEEITHMQGTIEGTVELVDEWPVGAELAVTNVGCSAAKAAEAIEAGLERLRQVDTHLCPDE